MLMSRPRILAIVFGGRVYAANAIAPATRPITANRKLLNLELDGIDGVPLRLLPSGR
jgi:hypothetical protein